MRSVTQPRFSAAVPVESMRLSRARWMFSTVRSSDMICCCVIASVATMTSGTRIAVSACSRSVQRVVQHDEQPEARAGGDAR